MSQAGFSQEWDAVYRQGGHLSVWPWTKLVSLVKRYGNLNPDSRVLEVGCGAGANIPFFAALGVDYYAVEGSRAMTEMLQSKYAGNDKVHIAQGDFTRDIHWGGDIRPCG